MSEMVAWLRCNDIDPDEVPFGSDVFMGTDDGTSWMIRYPVYARLPSGAVRCDLPTLKPAYDWREVPLMNDPPVWWLKEQKKEASNGGPLR